MTALITIKTDRMGVSRANDFLSGKVSVVEKNAPYAYGSVVLKRVICRKHKEGVTVVDESEYANCPVELNGDSDGYFSGIQIPDGAFSFEGTIIRIRWFLCVKIKKNQDQAIENQLDIQVGLCRLDATAVLKYIRRQKLYYFYDHVRSFCTVIGYSIWAAAFLIVAVASIGSLFIQKLGIGRLLIHSLFGIGAMFWVLYIPKDYIFPRIKRVFLELTAPRLKSRLVQLGQSVDMYLPNEQRTYWRFVRVERTRHKVRKRNPRTGTYYHIWVYNQHVEVLACAEDLGSFQADISWPPSFREKEIQITYEFRFYRNKNAQLYWPVVVFIAA